MPWAGRDSHTTVIDAAGAIYVIGGWSYLSGGGFTYYHDVWASTDGGALAGLREGGGSGGVWVGTQGVLGGTTRVLRGNKRGSQEYSMGF